LSLRKSLKTQKLYNYLNNDNYKKIEKVLQEEKRALKADENEKKQIIS